MDFAHTAKVSALRQKLAEFMERFVYPNERTYYEQIEASGDKHHRPKILEELKAKAKDAGLWNLFLPDSSYVITGRKWFTTGAMHAAVFIVVAVTSPTAPRHRRVSLFLVPRDFPGVTVVRAVPVYGA